MARVRMLPCLFALGLLSWILNSSAALAQGNGSILYNKIDAQLNTPLWQINPDGSGDQLLLEGVANGPVWSWDGQLVAVSGPTQQGVVSQNVYLYNPQTGGVQPVTDFQDIISSDHTQSTTFFPYFKAFSPDGQRMAVSVLAHAQTTDGHHDDPFLQIYGLDGTLQATVAIGSDDWNLARGNGVAWSPVEDVLVYPFAAVTIAEGTGNPFTFVTALYRVAPVQDVIRTGQYQQLTFPRAVQTLTTWAWEIDFQPAISPDGSQVAYVRSVVAISNGLLQFSTPSIRIINMDGSGDHPVVQFQQGAYVSRVSWSPDGTQLVFDLGLQASSNGVPEIVPDYSTMMLYTIHADGSSLQPLQQAPAYFPSWSPVAAGMAPPPRP